VQFHAVFSSLRRAYILSILYNPSYTPIGTTADTSSAISQTTRARYCIAAAGVQTLHCSIRSNPQLDLNALILINLNSCINRY